ncbi:MAG: GDP-mannose 4,6-dehydratase [Candidatus Cloacimonetes bacterium]|nr:GDP-mannose 4,6-dehydratase [Candidatus Cloacimonadota bacterium]
MKILITGIAGFIGSHLGEKLVQEHRIVGLDNFNDFYPPEQKWQNVHYLQQKGRFTLVQGDIRNRQFLAELFTRENFDLVIHLAAMAGVRPSIANPVLYTEVNVGGTQNLLEICRELGVKKFILASSSSIYGNNRKLPFAEDDKVDNPISPYAATKRAAELLCSVYHQLFGLSILALRFFTVYGPRQRPDLAIIKFARKIMAGEPIPVFGDGSSSRDYTYVDDIIDGIEQAVEYLSGHVCWEIFNLGESRTISLLEMIAALEKGLGIQARKEFLPTQPGDVQITYADLHKSRQVLGYDPSTGFEQGIAKFLNWLQEQP